MKLTWIFNAPTDTIVAHAAMWGARRAEDFAGEAIFQFDHLAFDLHLQRNSAKVWRHNLLL